MKLTTGENAPLTKPRLRAELTAPEGCLLYALMVGEDGRVGQTGHVMSQEQPQGPGLTLQAPANGRPWALDLDLEAVPAGVAKVMLAIVSDNDFNTGNQPQVNVRGDDDGTITMSYRTEGLTAQRLVVVIEIYRRQGSWRVRAIGSGFRNGLSDLAEKFGVPEPVSANHVPPPRAEGRRPSPSRLPALRPALGNGTVQLARGQSVLLSTVSRGVIDRARVEFEWTPGQQYGVTIGVEIDLDLSAVSFSSGKEQDIVYYRRQKTADGSLLHQGDRPGSDSRSDLEAIVVDFTKISADTTSIVLAITSYDKLALAEVGGMFCRVIDAGQRAELARYVVSEVETGATALMLGRMVRHEGAWVLEMIGEFFRASNPIDALAEFRKHAV